MTVPAQEYKNNNIFNQKSSLKLFVFFKMGHSCYFSLGENQDTF